ncbi:DoxX family protein [Nocardioides stalactiti]|uniref:DoxX family protein n=1 Tax=Nocardioides stalactiti TaxID=2755356 RepID=UPI0015FF92FA|nr:DoxX family protein [Nocardioides stalactiti]
MTQPLKTDAKVVVGAFLVSGTVHLVKPEVFEPLMPSWVPAHREVIVGSGVLELLCAAGMAFPRTRRVAGLASAALLVGVFPGNVKMFTDSLQGSNKPLQAVSLARLPLQLPMIRGALRAGRY